MLTTVPNQVTVYDLHRGMAQRQQRQRLSFEKVLEMCYSRIKRVARLRQSGCVFTVPSMIMGLPLYDINACMAFVARNLVGNGFEVHNTERDARELWISWDLSNRTGGAAAVPPADLSGLPGFARRPSPPPPPGRGAGVGMGAGRGEGVGGGVGGGEARHPPLFPISPPRGGMTSMPPPIETRRRGRTDPPRAPLCAFPLPIPTTDGMFTDGVGRAPLGSSAPPPAHMPAPPPPALLLPPSQFQRSITQFKPSGKFALRL